MALRNWWQSAWASIALICALAFVAGAAEISVESPGSDLIQAFENSPGYFSVPPRVMRINGEIRLEDVQTIETVLNDLWNKHQLGYQEGQKFAAILNSSGGSFKAGIEISKLFNSFGVPTFVPPGGSCLSACAVIFMSGSFLSMGGEGGVFRARTVALPAELGFHRPFLPGFVDTITPSVLSSMPPKKIAAFFADEYQAAFNLANQLIQDMLAVDAEAWSPDLLLRMLTATAKSGETAFVRLETVQDALSWGIEIGQARPPRLETAEQKFEAAFALCFNHGPTVSSSIGRFWPKKDVLEREYRFNREDVPKLYQNTRHPAGRRIQIYIHHEAPMGCEVTFSGTIAKVSVGAFQAGDPTQNFDLSTVKDRLWGHYPYTPLISIATPPAAGHDYRCIVLNGAQRLDDEPCQRRSSVSADGEFVEAFIWPSGSKTVVQTHGVQVRLNGQDITLVENLPPGMTTCLKSSQTGRTFCFGPR